ncbi:MAG: urea ABC transporter substrate-binding protein [Gemmataceae bacterium]
MSRATWCESRPHLLPEDFVRLVEQLPQEAFLDERRPAAEELATRLRALETEARRRGDETTLATPRLQNVAGATQENGGAGQENGANASTLVRPAAGVTQSAPIEPLWRRPFLLGAFFTALILGGFGFFLIHSRSDVQADDRDDDAPRFTGPPIRVGILQSTSGTMADSGSAVVDATLLAIEEINKAGGIKGRPIEYLLRDGESDADSYAEGAERLIAEDKVSVIFGCWTSSGRKRVMPIVEKHHSLLLYPVQYEGLESSPNIVYLGGTPNQQILPAVRFCFAELGKRRFFLVGSDYIFPHAANEIIKDELKRLGATVVGEDYVPLGESNVQPVIDRILKSRADVILNTINGDSNRPFFRRLRQAGITPEKVPTVSFSIAEPELRLLGTRDMAGDYVACSYFMSLGDEANREFVKKFRARFGPERVTSDPMLAAYASVHVWAEAVAKAQTAEPKQVLAQLRDADFDGPGGTIKIDPKCLHAWKRSHGPHRRGSRIEVLWAPKCCWRRSVPAEPDASGVGDISFRAVSVLGRALGERGQLS